MTEEPQKTKQQVIDQYRVIVHLAKALIEAYDGLTGNMKFFGDNDVAYLEEMGRRSAAHMEKLGNMINALDAGTEEDEWTFPIFKAAQKLWPQGETTP